MFQGSYSLKSQGLQIVGNILEIIPVCFSFSHALLLLLLALIFQVCPTFGYFWTLLETPHFNYESFDLSKTHSLSTQDLVKIFIHSLIHWFIDWFITMTAGEIFLKQKISFKKSRKSVKNKNKIDNIYLLLYIMIECSGSFYLRKYALKTYKK